MTTVKRIRPAGRFVGPAAVTALLDRVLWTGPDRSAKARAAILALMQRTGCSDMAAAERIAHETGYTE